MRKHFKLIVVNIGILLQKGGLFIFPFFVFCLENFINFFILTLHNILLSKIIMKKLLFWILTFLWIWLSFCSADFCNFPYNYWSIYLWDYFYQSVDITPSINNSVSIVVSSWVLVFDTTQSLNYILFDSNFSPISNWEFFVLTPWTYYINVSWTVEGQLKSTYSYQKIHDFWNFQIILPDEEYFPIFNAFNYFYYNVFPFVWWWWSSTPSDITVYYNNSQSNTSITCDWTQAIEIEGLSTITSTNTFTPYFNIDYIDEDNQILTESYSKDILYLSGATFKKTYTWNNIRILTAQLDSESIFSWYVPTFDVTWSVDPNDEFTWNVFNNFADNSLKYLLSNIPSYIQYFIILAILFLILWFVKKFRRK